MSFSRERKPSAFGLREWIEQTQSVAQ